MPDPLCVSIAGSATVSLRAGRRGRRAIAYCVEFRPRPTKRTHVYVKLYENLIKYIFKMLTKNNNNII